MSQFTVEDIPKTALPQEPAAFDTPPQAGDPAMGIPQSSAAPDFMRETFGSNPWDDEEKAHEEALGAWYRAGVENLDKAVLDPDTAFKDADLSFAADRDEARRLVINDSWLELNHDEPVAPDELQRRMQIQKVSLARFGEMVDSDEALFPLIQKDAVKRKDTRELGRDLTVAAYDDAMLPSDQAPGFGGFREKLKAHAGYDSEREADYLEAWHETRRDAKERVDAFREPLVTVWRAFKMDGNITAAAMDAYAKLTPEQRPEFMDALAIRAKALPEEERKTFWQNMGKVTGQAVSDYGRNATESMTSNVQKGGTVGWEDFLGSNEAVAARNASDAKTREDFQLRRNFAADVRKVAREDYDPLKSAFGDGKPGFWEGVAYQAPGVTATSLTMAVPYVGMPTMALSMEGSAYEQMRGRMLAAGKTDEESTAIAEGLAPFIAAPQAALEKIGFGLWSRKMPGLSKAIDSIGDQISNRLLRGAVKTGTIGTAETAIELAQDSLVYIVQDIAAGLSEDIPDVDWGKELSGTWASAPEIFFTMLPLSILGAAGGLSAESRHAAFSRATTTELQALGINSEGIAAINAANGPSSLASAVDSAMASRDPNSEEAIAAVGALKLQLETQRQARSQLDELGYSAPSFVQSPEGITVFDGEGKELGSAPDLSGAVRIARANTVALDDMQADQVAVLGSLMEAARAAVELDPSSTVEVNLGEFDPSQATPQMAARFAAQVALKEQAEGGTGDIARSVLGYSATEMAQGVRQTVNRLFKGAAVTDVFHETFHGLRRQARAAGTITKPDEIAMLRALDTVLAGKTTKDGTQLRFIPDEMTDEQVSDTLLDEAFSEIAEMEILRTRKGQGKGKLGLTRGVISRNLTALTKLMPGTIGKWTAFMQAVRARWGLSLSRALAMKKAERDGTFDKTDYDAYLDKLLGLDQQVEHDAGVQGELSRILGMPEEIADDDIPFSIGRADGGIPQTAANIIALAKELDPVAFKAAVESAKAYIQRRRDEEIPLGLVLEGDQVTLAAQGVLVKYADDPRALAMLDGYGEDQFSRLGSFSIGRREITKETDKHDGSRVGTAYQGKVKPTTQQTNDGMHSVVGKELEKQMGMLTHFVKPSKDSPDVVAVELPKWITKFKNAARRRDAFIEFTRDNLLALYDAFEKLPGYALERSTHRYDGARKIADEISAASGLTSEQSAAIIAAFSPMKDWFQNVAMAKYFSDTWANHRTVKISQAEHGATMAAMLESAQDPAKRKLEFALIDGKSIDELWNEGTKMSKSLAAVVARVISQSVHGLEHEVYSPEGESMGIRKKMDGSSNTMVWQSDAFIIKALEIASDGSLENISRQLGEQHKIRNFYNNIISPGSPFGDATIDTHAVNAAVLFPMGNKGYLVDLNFGNAGVAGGGNKGIYWLFHESLRQAAAERGILPRQMQSITWEAVRGLFPDKMKRNKDFVANIGRIWDTAPDAETARNLILEGGIVQPEWLRADSGNNGDARGAAGLLGGTDGSQADSGGDVSPGVRQGQPRVEPSFSIGTLHESILDRIGEDALRLEQPEASYERKRQVLLECTAEILGDSSGENDRGTVPITGDASQTRMVLGRLGGLRVLRQKLASDIAVDLKVNFIGETLDRTDKLAVLAMSLRNPRFETFYLFALQESETGTKIVDAMAITSRIPCTAAIFSEGKSWDEGMDHHADFLKSAKATHYAMLHNHPSGDPSPSLADLSITRRHAEAMKSKGFKFLDHIVINHEKFSGINEDGSARAIELLANAHEKVDRYQVSDQSLTISAKADTPESFIEVAQKIGKDHSDPTKIIGVIVNTRLAVMASMVGTAEDYLNLSNDQLQNYGRDQGGVFLMLHAKAESGMKAREMMDQFLVMNRDNRLIEMVVEFPDKGLGGYMSARGSGIFRYQESHRFFGGDTGDGNSGTRIQEGMYRPSNGGESAFSLGPAKVAGILSDNALARITDPRRRTHVMSRIARDFNAMRLQIERIASLSGIRRSKGDLRREAAAREELAAEEKIGMIHQRFGSLLADEDLVKIKQQPVNSYLATTRADGKLDPFRGRLKSKAQAIKDSPDLFQLHRVGDYDGSDGISRSVFGGTLMPDQAAQELFDNHLISELTADAMWEALMVEQNTVAKFKEMLVQAQEQIRAAKVEAKQETNEWLATQGKDQEVNFSDKEEIRRSLRMLDAILLALPAEIRGKIGGYTQISMIATDEARLAYLKDKLAKADKELETYLRVEYAKEWEALLAKAAPKSNEAGQRPTGSIAADAYDIFRIAEAAMGMSFAEGEAEADKWDAIADHPDTEEKDIDLARVKAQMIRLTMNWNSADAARREQAVLEGDKIYFDGLRGLAIENSRRRERLGKLRASAIKGTGKTGSRMEREAARQAASSKGGELLAMRWELLSFGQLVNVLFGEKSDAGKWFNAREIAASNAAYDGFQAKANSLESLFDTLSGNRFDGEKLRHRMATAPTIKVKDALGVDHTFTDSQAVTFLLMWRQEDGKRHMEGLVDEETGAIISTWGWNDDAAASIESQLSSEGQAVMAFLGSSYGEEYGRINEVFRRIWNVSMPRHKMYAPLSVNPVQGKGDSIMDPVSGDSMGAGMTPGSLKNRSFSAIAEPEFKDAFQVYLQHARQMEHFIAYGEFSRDALGVINRRETRGAILAAGGPAASATLSKWVDYFALGGLHDANMGSAWTKVLGGMLGRISQAALVGRVSVLCIQSLQLGAAAFKMPVGSFLTRIAKLTTGQLGWGDAIRSEYIQRRMDQMPLVVRDMMAGMASGTPNRAKYLATMAGRSITGADGLFTAGTYAIFYDYHLKLARQAKDATPEATAHREAERLTDQVAQPTRTGARSWLEVANQGNPAFRAAWNFSSDPRQKMSLFVYEAMRRDISGGEKAMAAGKSFGLVWIVGGVLATLLRTISRDLRNDDDDEIFDERYWNPYRLGLMAAMGPLGGVPFLGGMLEDSTYKATGQFMPRGGMLGFLADGAALPRKWSNGKIEPLKDLETLATAGAGFSGTSAAAASAMHLIRDLVGLAENLEGPD